VLPGRKYGIEDFLRIAWRRKWLIVIPFVVVSVATVAVVRRLPDVYKSETTILVVPQRVPESYVRSTVTDRIGERLQSLEQQILSRSRLEKIIVDLNLYQELRATSSMESLVNRLRAAVEVDPVVRGDAFTISHTSRDPKTAQIVTERLATDFIRLNVADRGTLAQTTSVFLKERLVEQEKRLIEQEKKLEDYRVAHAGELPSQAGSNLQGMQSSRAQLQTVVDSISHERERLGAKERELTDLLAPDPVSQAVAAAAIAPALSPADELTQARAQLEVMEGRLTDVHPDVRRMRRRVEQLEAQVKLQAQAETAQAGSPASVTAPPVVRTVASVQKENRIRDARAELAAINRRIGALQKEQGRLQQEINLYQARLEMVPIRESEQVELTRDYETTNELYRDLLSKHEEAKIAEAMEKGRVGEQFRVLDPAVVPDRPFRPDRLKLNAIGIALGLFLGLGIVVALEFTDSTLKSEEDIRTVLALPVIATIPIFVPKVGGAMRQRLRGLLSGSGAGVVALAVTIVGSVRS
jgi:polysaccharide chain length determinant protein (PEP-CTERM system associated)